MEDSEYKNLDSHLYMEANGQMRFIKPSDYEAWKTKRYSPQIGRIEDMKYGKGEDCFICAARQKL